MTLVSDNPAAAGPDLAAPEATVSEVIVEALAWLGVERAYGITGGALASLFSALSTSSIEVSHCRHESGAAFAALEDSLATGKPTAVFTTTGPGVMNALTGMQAARWEGGRVILLSAASPPAVRGRWACQETSAETLVRGVYEHGPLFDFAVMLEHPEQLHRVITRLAAALAAPGGFIAHLALPSTVQSSVTRCSPVAIATPRRLEAPAAGLDAAAACLAREEFVIWAGFGARAAAPTLLRFAERTGAAVMCTPRAKGVFPESHPLYLGLTGLGGHTSVDHHFARQRPKHILVLGTRLGEASSYYDDRLTPSESFIHVDLDPAAFGSAFPDVPVSGIVADCRDVLERLIARLPRGRWTSVDGPAPPAAMTLRAGPVRAEMLMAAVQRVVVDRSDAVVLSEVGNAFAWANHVLRFDESDRYRVSVCFGSMGHAAAGVLGVARSGRPAVALTGDASMLMFHELSTAVAVGAPAVWVVLNDGQHGMVAQGMMALGLPAGDVSLPPTDFAGFARALGAVGFTVHHEADLDAALADALACGLPAVVDVKTDPTETGPWMKRIQSLIQQGQFKTSADRSARPG